jgi:hypothetical protein
MLDRPEQVAYFVVSMGYSLETCVEALERDFGDIDAGRQVRNRCGDPGRGRGDAFGLGLRARTANGGSSRTRPLPFDAPKRVAGRGGPGCATPPGSPVGASASRGRRGWSSVTAGRPCKTTRTPGRPAGAGSHLLSTTTGPRFARITEDADVCCQRLASRGVLSTQGRYRPLLLEALAQAPSGERLPLADPGLFRRRRDGVPNCGRTHHGPRSGQARHVSATHDGSKP